MIDKIEAEQTNPPATLEGWYQKVATVVLATGSVVGLHESADAAIVFTDVSGDGITTTGTSGQQTIYFSLFTSLGEKGQADVGDLNTNPIGGGGDTPRDWAQFTLGRYGNFGAFVAVDPNNGPMGEWIPGSSNYPGPYPSPFNLAKGAVIGSNGQFLVSPAGYIQTIANSTDPNLDGPFGNFTIPGSGYLGLRFSNDNGANYYYGWAQIVLPAFLPATPANIQLLGFAYETTPNASILAGVTAVPEPVSTTLLALGAAGLVEYRRRRKQKRGPQE
jgi:hypothetical protein